MKHYVDITLLPSADITLYFLWEKVYQQVHLALVESQQTHKNTCITIGVAFPEYAIEPLHLGKKLRLFAASADALADLNITQWLVRLQDYVHITSIRNVPTKIDGYAYFKRLQPKSNNERLARRKAKRNAMSKEEATAYFAKRKEVYTRAPFIRINSHSSSKRYRVFILRVDSKSLKAGKCFSSYGLSSTSAVPIF